jgi:proliferating cell nuclear antigen PCNA
MEFVPRDSSQFRSAIEALKDYIPQIQMHIDSEGVRIRGMDSSHVGFLDYKHAAEDCEVIKVDAPLVLGLHSAVLARVLAGVGAGDRVCLRTSAKTREKLLVEYSNEKIAKKAVYEVPLVDIETDSLDIPDMSYPAIVKARTADVMGVIKDVAHFGDTVSLKLDEEGFHMTTQGDAARVEQTLENTEDRDMTLEGSDSVEASFGMKYLSGFLKGGAALSPVLELGFDPAQPLRATFAFGHDSHFVAYLAPKLRED